MNRRNFLELAALGCAQAAVAPSFAQRAGQPDPSPVPERPGGFSLEEATIPELGEAIRSGRESSASLVKKYLRRIKELDVRGPALNSVIELNPEAHAIARALDAERAAKGPRGPLHGIPVLIKDNIDTHDHMTTTAGSLALLGSIPAQDSTVVKKLREAGAVILGKTNLSEWANFRSTRSTSGWSGRGGLTKNPHALDRNTSGSSSGSGAAAAASLCAAAVGTETDGSIVSPSSFCGIVGIKPTVGLVSRAGIIPISQTQDTAGPMARTVADAAILLGVLQGEDPRDPATEMCVGKIPGDYTRFLDPNGLREARLGVARKFFGVSPEADQVMESAIELMKQHGAVIVDPADLPTHGQFGDAEDIVLCYEFKHGLNAYLNGLGPSAPVHNLDELIRFNENNKAREMPYFGQETLLRAREKGALSDKVYLNALEKCRRLSQELGIDAIMNQHRLDALIAPTTGPAHKTDLVYGDRDTGGSSTPAAVAGYPDITVPAGQVFGLPVGISFFGRAWSEPVLIRLAFAFEQACKARRAPQFRPTVG